MPQSFVLIGIHDLYLLAVSPVFVWLTIWLTYSSQVILPYLWSGHICAPLRQAHAILPGTGTSRILFLVLTNSKYVLAKSAKVLTSGPPTSGTRPAAPESASSVRRSATSPMSIGWKRKPFGARATGPRPSSCTNLNTNSWNCVALRIVHGTGDASIICSTSSFIRKYG